MINIHILYNQYLDFLGEKKKIGGVETYIDNLIKIFFKAGYCVNIYQFSDINFQKKVNGATVYGIIDKKLKMENLLEFVNQNADFNEDILIFAADFYITKNKFKKVIAIQHGIGWDIPYMSKMFQKFNWTFLTYNALRAWKKFMQYKNCKVIVCVDYNFVNWYRTQIVEISNKLKVIPNFTFIPQYKKVNSKQELSIIFARRFYDYRGTRIFVEAILKILEKYPNIKVTVAGEGPDESWMKNQFISYSNVKFIKFAPEDSIQIHSLYDIAVIPSLGSEGTSLSLLEAMAAKCAVICTNVGGLTNIVIDGFNGIMIQPRADELENAIEYLYLNKKEREYMAENGYDTVRKGFSFERWEEKWLKVLKEI